MRIGRVSERLEVPIPTIRRWTLEFAEYLGPDCSGSASGVPRKFSAADMAILSQIKAHLQETEGATYASVREALRQGYVAETVSTPGGDRRETREEHADFWGLYLTLCLYLLCITLLSSFVGIGLSRALMGPGHWNPVLGLVITPFAALLLAVECQRVRRRA